MCNEPELYRKMYLRLFRTYDDVVSDLTMSLAMEHPLVKKAINDLIHAMQDCEEMYIEAGESQENC